MIWWNERAQPRRASNLEPLIYLSIHTLWSLRFAITMIAWVVLIVLAFVLRQTSRFQSKRRVDYDASVKKGCSDARDGILLLMNAKAGIGLGLEDAALVAAIAVSAGQAPEKAISAAVSIYRGVSEQELTVAVGPLLETARGDLVAFGTAIDAFKNV